MRTGNGVWVPNPKVAGIYRPPEIIPYHLPRSRINRCSNTRVPGASSAARIQPCEITRGKLVTIRQGKVHFFFLRAHTLRFRLTHIMHSPAEKYSSNFAASNYFARDGTSRQLNHEYFRTGFMRLTHHHSTRQSIRARFIKTQSQMGLLKQIPTCNRELPSPPPLPARISSKPHNCRRRTIVSTNSSRVVERKRTSDFVPNKLPVDGNLPFTI